MLLFDPINHFITTDGCDINNVLVENLPLTTENHEN